MKVLKMLLVIVMVQSLTIHPAYIDCLSALDYEGLIGGNTGGTIPVSPDVYTDPEDAYVPPPPPTPAAEENTEDPEKGNVDGSAATRIPTVEENDLLWKTFGADVVTIKDTSTTTEKSYQYLDKNGVVIGSMKQGTGTDTAQHWFDKNNIEIRGGDVALTLQNIQVGDYFINPFTNQATAYVGKNSAGRMVWQDKTGQYVWDFTPESWKAAYSQILGYFSFATPDFKLNSGVAQKPVTNPYAQGYSRAETSAGSEGGTFFQPTSEVLLALKRDEYGRFIMPTDATPEELALINLEMDKFLFACYGDIRRNFDGSPMYDEKGYKNPEPANLAQYLAVMKNRQYNQHELYLWEFYSLRKQEVPKLATDYMLERLSYNKDISWSWTSLPAKEAAALLEIIMPDKVSVLDPGSIGDMKNIIFNLINLSNRDEIVANMSTDKAALLLQRMSIDLFPGLSFKSKEAAGNILNKLDAQKAADILLQYDTVVTKVWQGKDKITYVPAVSSELALSVLSTDSDKAATILSLMSASPDQPGYVYNMNPGLPRQSEKAAALLKQLTPGQQASILASKNMTVANGAKLIASMDKQQASLALVELDKTNKTKADDIRLSSMDRNSPEFKAIATERITGYYNTYFKSAPDAATLETWTNKAIAGSSFDDIKSGIYRTTPEFKAEATAVIELSYNINLNRASDPAGMEYYLNKAIAGVSYEDIRKEIQNSAEYKALHPGSTGPVTDPATDLAKAPPAYRSGDKYTNKAGKACIISDAYQRAATDGVPGLAWTIIYKEIATGIVGSDINVRANESYPATKPTPSKDFNPANCTAYEGTGNSEGHTLYKSNSANTYYLDGVLLTVTNSTATGDAVYIYTGDKTYIIKNNRFTVEGGGVGHIDLTKCTGFQGLGNSQGKILYKSNEDPNVYYLDGVQLSVHGVSVTANGTYVSTGAGGKGPTYIIRNGTFIVDGDPALKDDPNKFDPTKCTKYAGTNEYLGQTLYKSNSFSDVYYLNGERLILTQTSAQRTDGLYIYTRDWIYIIHGNTYERIIQTL